MGPTAHRAALAIVTIAVVAAPAGAQPAWVEVTGPHVTVVSDAGTGRARDIAWQFEQVHEALSQTFPWIRWNLSRPLLVFAARNESSMRTLVPGTFEQPDGRMFVAVSSVGRDRAYIALRADVRVEDKEGENPYQSAYWAYTSQALGETFNGLPVWLWRGLAELMSNTIVRDNEIQIGRILPANLRRLRGQARLALKDLVTIADDDTRLRSGVQFLSDVDASGWAFVHFLMFANEGALQPKFNAFVAALLQGTPAATALANTVGDVAQYENPFNVYVNREIFRFVRLGVAARLGRENFPARPVPPAQMAVLRAGLHVSSKRPKEARAQIAAARAADPALSVDEAEALLDELEGRDDDQRAHLEKAVAASQASWYAPYRLAYVLPTNDKASLERVEGLLKQATERNPYADDALSYLAEVMANLDRGEAALAPSDKAIGLVPSSSRHHLSRARVLRRLGRPSDANRAAGIGRAFARTEAERSTAQSVLALLAKEALATQARAEAASNPAANAPSAPPRTPEIAPADGPPVDAAALAAASPSTGDSGVGMKIASCFSNPASCRKVLPDIAGDCNGGDTDTSPAACRNAGYILDAGIGVPAAPVMAADFYKKGCARKDEISCVRLATLQSQGRGVPRDAAGALAVLDASCKNGVQEGCFRLGVHLSSTKAPADLARARDVLAASCKAEFTESCAWLKKLPQ